MYIQNEYGVVTRTAEKQLPHQMFNIGLCSKCYRERLFWESHYVYLLKSLFTMRSECCFHSLSLIVVVIPNKRCAAGVQTGSRTAAQCATIRSCYLYVAHCVAIKKYNHVALPRKKTCDFQIRIMVWIYHSPFLFGLLNPIVSINKPCDTLELCLVGIYRNITHIEILDGREVFRALVHIDRQKIGGRGLGGVLVTQTPLHGHVAQLLYTLLPRAPAPTFDRGQLVLRKCI